MANDQLKQSELVVIKIEAYLTVINKKWYKLQKMTSLALQRSPNLDCFGQASGFHINCCVHCATSSRFMKKIKISISGGGMGFASQKVEVCYS